MADSAPSAAAAGYPNFGTPYRVDAGPVAGAPAASSYAGASPYAADASPYAAAAAAGYGAGVPGAGLLGAGGSGYPVSRFTPAGYPMSDSGAPGVGPDRWVPSQDALEGAFRSAGLEKAKGERQSSVIMGGIGVALLVIAAVVLRATLSSGTGMVWTWGFVGGAVFLVKAAMSYVRSVRGGAPPFGPLGWVVSGGALVLSVALVVTSVQAARAPMPVEVGSCFTDRGADVQHVDCSDPHDYTAVAVTDTLNACPSVTDVFARLDGEVVCLVDAGFGFGD